MISKSEKIKDVLRTRSYNCLYAVYGDITVGDLCDIYKKSRISLLKIPNFGRVSMEEIKGVVNAAEKNVTKEPDIDEQVLMTSKFALYEDMLSLKDQNAMLQTQLQSSLSRGQAYRSMCQEYERDNEILRNKLNSALSELASKMRNRG